MTNVMFDSVVLHYILVLLFALVGLYDILRGQLDSMQSNQNRFTSWDHVS